jgi:hypothetical protein
MSNHGMTPTTLLLLLGVVASATTFGCKRNSPEQLAAGKASADAYCDCVTRQLKRPINEVAKDKSRLCDAEEKAFETAWSNLPAAGNDPKGLALYNQRDACTQQLRAVKNHQE